MIKYLGITMVFIIAFSFKSNAQTVDDFIREYKKAYEGKRETVYTDTSLIYIPAVMNFVVSQEDLVAKVLHCRECFWEFLTPPILADNEAIEKNTGERYFYPDGWMSLNQSHTIVGPATHSIEYYSLIQMPLFDYLKNNQIDYVFTVVNIGIDSKSGEFWVIQDNHILLLLFDEEQHSFYPVDASNYVLYTTDKHFFHTLAQ